MKEEPYDRVHSSGDYCELEFISEGPKGRIVKRIEFRPKRDHDYFELVFGNKLPDGSIDFYSVNNNGDTNKIMLTVADAVQDFFNVYPERTVLFLGSTPARTRLYQILITRHYDELKKAYSIFALQGENFVRFKKNMNADAFYVTKRK